MHRNLDRNCVLYVNRFGRMAIFIIVILIHKYGMSFPLPIVLTLLQCLKVLFILVFYFLNWIYSKIPSRLISMRFFSWLHCVCLKATDFFVLIVYPVTFLNVFSSCRNYPVESLGSFMCWIISSANKCSFTSFFPITPTSSPFLLW